MWSELSGATTSRLWKVYLTGEGDLAFTITRPKPRLGGLGGVGPQSESKSANKSSVPLGTTSRLLPTMPRHSYAIIVVYLYNGHSLNLIIELILHLLLFAFLVKLQAAFRCTCSIVLFHSFIRLSPKLKRLEYMNAK